MQTRVPSWADRVKEALDAQGHTAAWLAEEIGIDRSTLSRMMRGYPDYRLTPDKAGRIAKALRIPYFWLFEDEISPQVPVTDNLAG